VAEAVSAADAAGLAAAGAGDKLDIKVTGNDVEKAIKSLKRQLQKEGLFKEIKLRSYYEKPSVKDKRKRREAQKKRMKALKNRGFQRKAD